MRVSGPGKTAAMGTAQPSFLVGGHGTVGAEGCVIDSEVDWAEVAVKGVISMQGSKVV